MPYQLSRLARRHAAVFAATVIVVAVILIALVVITGLWIQSERLRTKEQEAREQVEHQRVTARLAAIESAVRHGDVAGARLLLSDPPSTSVSWGENAVGFDSCGDRLVIGYGKMGNREAGDPVGAVVLGGLRLGDSRVTLTHDAPVTAAGFSPNGRWLVTGTFDGKIVVFCYFTASEVESLFRKLADAYLSAHVVFDSMSRFTIWGRK